MRVAIPHTHTQREREREREREKQRHTNSRTDRDKRPPSDSFMIKSVRDTCSVLIATDGSSISFQVRSTPHK